MSVLNEKKCNTCFSKIYYCLGCNYCFELKFVHILRLIKNYICSYNIDDNKSFNI